MPTCPIFAHAYFLAIKVQLMPTNNLAHEQLGDETGFARCLPLCACSIVVSGKCMYSQVGDVCVCTLTFSCDVILPNSHVLQSLHCNSFTKHIIMTLQSHDTPAYKIQLNSLCSLIANCNLTLEVA